jgi:hypothetical protein
MNQYLNARSAFRFALVLFMAASCRVHAAELPHAGAEYEQDTHSEITYQAFLMLPSGAMRDELAQYIGGTSSIFDCSDAGTIVEGSWEEDCGTNSLNHFWDPDSGPDAGLQGGESAYQYAGELYDEAKVLYATGNLIDRRNAYYILGRVAHLLEDIAQPGHVHLDIHGPFDPPDNYEPLVNEIRSTYDWNTPPPFGDAASNLLIAEALGGYPLRPVDYATLSANITISGPAIYQGSSPILKLFLNLAETADYFESEDTVGDSDNIQFNQPPSAITWHPKSSPPPNANPEFVLSHATLHANYLVPLAMRYVAGLYQAFWDQTHPPTVTTGAATNVGQTTATVSATVHPNGSDTTLYFDYGTTTSYGIMATYGGVGSGTSPVTKSYNLSNLSCGATYQYRARAQNAGGTRNGANKSFTTSACPQQGTCANPILISSFPFSDSNSTAGRGKSIDGYSCPPASGSEAGPEVVYQFSVQTAGNLTVTVSDGAGVDIDPHLLSSCSQSACLARNDTTFTVAIQPGTYFIVCDTWTNSSGTQFPGAFTLNVSYTGSADTTRPTVSITSPTSSSTYSTSNSTINLAGSASDNVAVTRVTWVSDQGGSGTANGTTSWSVSGVTLYEGANVLTVTAWDAANNTRTDTITVTYAPADTTDPTVKITSPTSSSTYSTGAASLTLGGTSSDNVAVTQVTCRNAGTGNTVTASGTTSWSCSVGLVSGSNAITVTARDAANNQGADVLTVTQASCTYSTCSTMNVGTGTGSGSCGVTATSGCAWTASSNATSWLTTSSSGSGDGRVSFNFTANTGASRTGIITVQDQTITVNQGTTCTYSLCSPTASGGAGPGSSACSVTTTSNCAWTAISDSPTWLTATGSGNGSGTFSYSYTANTGDSRTGTITVQEQAHTVMQAGTLGCDFTQQGPKLVGMGAVGNADQGLSVSLSADGNTAIVGGTNDNGQVGAAWVWTRSGGVWTPQGAKLVGAGAVGNAQQGYSVALSADGNTAIVGGKYDNTNVGAAWIWTRSGSAWTPQGKLLASDSVGHSYQGTSVALSDNGNTAIVGGYFDNKAGAAWVWTRSGGIWTQQGNKLVAADAVGSAHQGYSVSLSGDGNTAIIGGNYDNYSNGGPGAAWIWTRSGGVWTKQAKLVGSGAVGNAKQGASVALSGDGNTALVGGSADNNYAGAAWVWTRSGGVWTPQGAKLIGSGAINSEYGAQQGDSVSLSNDGSKALVGGTHDNGDIGAAWVFVRTGGVWTTQTKLVGSGAVGTGVYQGRSVSLSGNGNTAIIGGYADNSNVGAAWVFACAESNASPAAPTGVTAAAVTSTRVDVAWSAVAGATYQIDRKGAGGGFSQVGTSATNSFSDNTASASSAYLYRVRAVKDSIESPSSTPDLATTVIFADNPLTAGIVVKAAHLSQLRMAANAVRLLAGLGAASFTDTDTGGTAIRGLHITEIRTSLDAALGALGLATSGYTNAPLTGVAVKAVHVQELRSRLQ